MFDYLVNQLVVAGFIFVCLVVPQLIEKIA